MFGYSIRNDNLKRESVTDMVESAVLSLDNYYAKKNSEEFIIEKLHNILRAKLIAVIPVVDSEIGIRISEPIEF